MVAARGVAEVAEWEMEFLKQLGFPVTPERAAKLREVAAAQVNPFLKQILTECLDEIEKLQHDKQSATNAANRAITKLAKGRK